MNKYNEIEIQTVKKDAGEKRMETHACDLIDRQAAIDALKSA